LKYILSELAFGTVQGAVATWRAHETRLTQGPGRYHSLYRTGVFE